MELGPRSMRTGSPSMRMGPPSMQTGSIDRGPWVTSRGTDPRRLGRDWRSAFRILVGARSWYVAEGTAVHGGTDRGPRWYGPRSTAVRTAVHKILPRARARARTH